MCHIAIRMYEAENVPLRRRATTMDSIRFIGPLIYLHLQAQTVCFALKSAGNLLVQDP